MFELLHCPSTSRFHFNYLDVVLGIPILPFNCMAQQWKQVKPRATSQVRYVRRKRRPRVMCWNTRSKASYPKQMGQNLAQSGKLMHTSMPAINNSSMVWQRVTIITPVQNSITPTS